MAEQVCSLVDSLPNITDKSGNLQQIHILISQIHPRNLADIVANISFNVIFECLNTNDVDQITVCCDVLEKLLMSVDPRVLLAQFDQDLLQGLSHPAKSVQLLCLHQAQRIAENIPQQLARYSDILNQVISLLGEESLQVAKQAGILLMVMGQCADGMDYLFKGHGLVSFQALLGSSDVTRCRVYELVTDLSRLSSEALHTCSSSGLLQHLVNEIFKEDILVQLNAIELLTRLATVQHGLMYMEQQGIVTKLDQMLQGVDSDPMTGFLLPGLVKFFGSVAYLQPKEVCNDHPAFLPLVFNLCENGDTSTRPVAVETLGLIGSTVDGKRVLELHGAPMNSACRLMGSLLKEPSNEIKMKSLGAIESLLKLAVCDQTTDLLSLTLCWYKKLAPDLLTLLLDSLEKPFHDVRCAIFPVIVAMATQVWGQEQFRDHATFTEFLLNRNTESTKEGKELKYELVQTLVENPTTMETMGRVYFVKLKEFAREGAFFIQAESAVAMESES